MEIYSTIEPRIQEMIKVIKDSGAKVDLAITEGHLSLSPHNTNSILYMWLSAIFHARVMNLYERYGEFIKIATLADFCGTRWTVNAVMIPTPQWRKRSFLMPAGTVMALFGKNRGVYGIAVEEVPSYLDVSASRDEKRVFLHVVNYSLTKGVNTEIDIFGLQIRSALVKEIAPGDLFAYVNEDKPDIFSPKEKLIEIEQDQKIKWYFPPASVSSVILEIRQDSF